MLHKRIFAHRFYDRNEVTNILSNQHVVIIIITARLLTEKGFQQDASSMALSVNNTLVQSN